MKKKTSMEWDALQGAGENARLRLPAMVAEFFALGRQAAMSAEPAQLHAFRLAAKRFRYTLELFRPLYGPGLEARIEAVRRIQSMLGDRQDFTVLSARLRNTLMPSGALLEALLRSDEKGNDLEERFRSFWRDEFDAAGQESRWVKYVMRRPAVRRPRKSPADTADQTAPSPQRRQARTARRTR